MRNTVSSLIALVAVVCCLPAFPLASNHPPGLPVGQQPDWPEGLADFLNSPGRVHGYFVNANDFFFYRGDTDEFNQFLDQYARLEKTPLTVVLQPGPGKTNFITRDDKEITFDWKVDVYCRGWAREIPPDLPGGKSQYVAIIQLHTGGEVNLNKVNVPVNVEVKYVEPAKQFTEFVAAHEAERQRAKGAGSTAEVSAQEANAPAPPVGTPQERAPRLVNLDPYVTAFWEEYHGGLSGSDLPLKPGEQRIGGITFRVGKGVVQLGGSSLKDKPSEVKGIKVGMKLEKLHVLHGLAAERPEATRLATYVVHYEDNSSAEIPIEYGVHVRSWLASWRDALEVSGADVAWTAGDSSSPPIRLYCLTWENPRPDKALATIDFNSADGDSAPFVVAMTAEEAVAVPPAEPSTSSDYKSKRPRFIRLPLDENGSKVLLVTFDESKGTGTGYDLLLSDLDLDGKLEESERIHGRTLERNGRVLLSSFSPLKLDVPYKGDKSVLASWQVAFSYRAPRDVEVATPFGEAGAVVPQGTHPISPEATPSSPASSTVGQPTPATASAPVGTFHITANLSLRKDSTDWRYFLSDDIQTSESAETAPIWNFSRGLKLELSTRPDGRNKGNLGIGLRLLVGENDLRCMKAGQPIEAHAEIKKPDGTVLHSGDATLDKFVFG